MFFGQNFIILENSINSHTFLKLWNKDKNNQKAPIIKVASLQILSYWVKKYIFNLLAIAGYSPFAAGGSITFTETRKLNLCHKWHKLSMKYVISRK